MEHPNLVVLKTCANRPEAELVRGALENAGIEAIIRADSVGRMREHIAWSGAGFQVLVREDDLSAAQEAIVPVNESEEAEQDDPERSS